MCLIFTSLRIALNEIRKYRGQDEVSAEDFLRLISEKMKLMHIDEGLQSRSVNEGFSGGEKKRNEIFQMGVLEPSLALLDETDSGLDIDALKIVSDGVNALRGPNFSAIVVTHYQRLLNHIVPDVVHVLADGRIVKTGGKELAHQLEEEGYGWIERDREGAQMSMNTQGDLLSLKELVSETQGAERVLQSLQGVHDKHDREKAAQRFLAAGIPARGEEAWKYTDAAPFREGRFHLPEAKVVLSNEDVLRLLPPGVTGALVFCGWRVSR